jgi:hypothetical protein
LDKAVEVERFDALTGARQGGTFIMEVAGLRAARVPAAAS